MLMRGPLLAEAGPGSITLRHVLPALLVIVCAILGGLIDRDAPSVVGTDGPQFKVWLEQHPEVVATTVTQITIP